MKRMRKVRKKNKLEVLQFPGLSGDCNISHFITTRHGGVSAGAFGTLNLGEYGGDDPACVRENRRRVSEAMGFSPGKWAVPYQIHGAEIRCLTSSFLTQSAADRQALLQGVDAVVTDIPGLCVAVTTADCVPVLLYAPDRKVVAAIHAGWRGTVEHIAAETVGNLVEQYGCNPVIMQAAIGPSIGWEAFEVGEEVVTAFREAGMDLSRIMKRRPATGKACLDLGEANQMQLLGAGLSADHIEMSGICTYTHEADFFSARRLGIKSGRMVTGIFING